MTLIPPLINTIQDDFPDQVKGGNPLYILFSPYLDRDGIESQKSPKEILLKSVKTGTQGLTDRIVSPAVNSLSTLQRAIGRSLVSIREGINRALTIPTRGLFTMATTMGKSLNTILESVLGSVKGLFSTIQSILYEISGMAVTALNLQVTALNTLYASIGFFMMLLKVLGGIVIGIGIPMMFSIFLIPLAITLITVGSIMVNISLTSEAVIPKEGR